MSGSCSTVSNKAEKSLVGMSVCTTVIGADDAGVAQRLDGHGHRLQLVATARRTEVGDDDRFGAVDRGSGRPRRALQSRQTEAARRVLGERVSAVDAVAHHLAGQVGRLGHAPIVAETGRSCPADAQSPMR